MLSIDNLLAWNEAKDMKHIGIRLSSFSMDIRLLFGIAAVLAVCNADDHYPKSKQVRPKAVDIKHATHAKVMICFTKCMEEIASLSDENALLCYKNHVTCMQDFKFEESKQRKEKTLKMYSQLVYQHKCFTSLEECANEADESNLGQCATDMTSCLDKYRKFMHKNTRKLPKHIRGVAHRYQNCFRLGDFKARCIRGTMELNKKMNYVMLVSRCINTLFTCQNKEGSQANTCLFEFMTCKSDLPAQPKIEKVDPYSKIADRIHACFDRVEQCQESKKECIQELSTCILNVNIPTTPPVVLKHGYCFKGLQECSPNFKAGDAKRCMIKYRGCVQPHVMTAKSNKKAL